MTIFTVGLTGGIGSGKTTVEAMFHSLGVPSVDADVEARRVTNSNAMVLKKISEYFGPSVIDSDGQLIRRNLRSLIFTDKKKRQWLEALLHPIIRQAILDKLQTTSGSYVLLVSPLLFETQQTDMTDFNIVVDIPEEMQLHRTVKRDVNSNWQVQNIMDSQMPRQSKLRLADLIIDNSGSQESTIEQVRQAHHQLMNLVNSNM